MSPEENKALVRRFYAEIDRGNLAAMDELVAEEYLDHSPAPFPGLRPGRETGSSRRSRSSGRRHRATTASMTR
jgi:ketosteroid isomerase-like protein